MCADVIEISILPSFSWHRNLITLTLVSTSTKMCIFDLTGLIRVVTFLHLLYQFQATLSPEPRPELNDPIRAEPPWSSSFVVE